MSIRVVTSLFLFFTVMVPAVARLAHAESLPPDARVTVLVVDEDGQPIPRMPVHVWLSANAVRDSHTDANGMFVAEGPCTVKDVPIRVAADGWYESTLLYSFPNYISIRDNKWQPWNPTVTVAVRRIENPIPMLARCAETSIPEPGVGCGYDLFAGDWVAPWGVGRVSDVVFRIEGFWRDYRNNDSTLIVEFQRDGDGLIEYRVDTTFGRPSGSAFIMPRRAPSAGFQRSMRWRIARRPVCGGVQEEIIDEANVGGQNYIFRTRSQTDNSGSVTNAYYGKIHGNFRFVGATERPEGSWLSFTYYLNPTPNDRNLEFDPSRNLFTDLDPAERVKDP